MSFKEELLSSRIWQEPTQICILRSNSFWPAKYNLQIRQRPHTKRFKCYILIVRLLIITSATSQEPHPQYIWPREREATSAMYLGMRKAIEHPIERDAYGPTM